MMVAASHAKVATAAVRIRPIALPVEHGGWSLLLEPILLGLLLAPSLSGICLSFAAIGVFLARHPLKLAVADWRHKRRSGRTKLVKMFTVLYTCASVVFLVTAISLGGKGMLLPLLFAAPFLVLQLILDSAGRSRTLVAELAGSLATGSLATAIAITGGLPRPGAFGLWVAMSARTIPTILYLRARLRLLHRKTASPAIAITAHVIALLVVLWTAWMGIIPMFAGTAFLLLLLRAIIGFSRFDTKVTAKELGLRELSFGLVTVFVVAIAYILAV